MALLAALLMFPTNHAFSQNAPVRIAMAQIFCLDGDRPGNLARIERAIAEAKSQGAEIVTFPESSIFGWENPVAHGKASPIPGRDSDALRALARKYSVYLCVGLDEKDGDNLFDSCVLIDDAGNLLLKHRKVNVLPELMTPPYSEGDGAPMVVDTKFGRIGLLICADSFRAGLLEGMANAEPDLMLIPYGWAAQVDEWPGHGDSLTEVVQKVAKTVGCPVIGTDLVGAITNGPWAGRTYGGQSVAADRDGNVIAKGKDRDRDVVMVTVNLKSASGLKRNP